MTGAAMPDRIEDYLTRAKRFDDMATKATNTELKSAYQQLAQSYRVLARHREPSPSRIGQS